LLKKKIKKCICVIPARGGSKRIPLKNIKKFFGKPLIYYSIKNALSSKLFDKVLVSTDHEKIAHISKKYGAEIHLRSNELSDDITDTSSVMRNVIKYLENKKLFYEIFCCIYPTSVFTKSTDLNLGYKKLKKRINYVFSATEYDHTIYRSFLKKNGKIKPIFLNMEKKRTQDLPKTFYDAAQFYFGWRDSWMKRKKIFLGNSEFLEISKFESHDIDNIKDWNTAEKIWKFNKFLK